jgi:heme/copper-type cytochrome/quinol oxidase subunit 2
VRRGAVWIVVWPSWRPRIGWIVVSLSGFTVVMSKLAADSGEALEDALDRESSLLERHTELGDTFVWFALVFFVAVLALMLWDRAQRRKADPSGGSTGRARATAPAAIVLSILVVVTAAAASFRVYQSGTREPKASGTRTRVRPTHRGRVRVRRASLLGASAVLPRTAAPARPPAPRARRP